MLLARRPAASRSANAAAGVQSRPLLRGSAVGVVVSTAAWGWRGVSVRRSARGSGAEGVATRGWAGGRVGRAGGGAGSTAGGVTSSRLGARSVSRGSLGRVTSLGSVSLVGGGSTSRGATNGSRRASERAGAIWSAMGATEDGTGAFAVRAVGLAPPSSWLRPKKTARNVGTKVVAAIRGPGSRGRRLPSSSQSSSSSAPTPSSATMRSDGSGRGSSRISSSGSSFNSRFNLSTLRGIGKSRATAVTAWVRRSRCEYEAVHGVGGEEFPVSVWEVFPGRPYGPWHAGCVERAAQGGSHASDPQHVPEWSAALAGGNSRGRFLVARDAPRGGRGRGRRGGGRGAVTARRGCGDEGDTARRRDHGAEPQRDARARAHAAHHRRARLSGGPVHAGHRSNRGQAGESRRRDGLHAQAAARGGARAHARPGSRPLPRVPPAAAGARRPTVRGPGQGQADERSPAQRGGGVSVAAASGDGLAPAAGRRRAGSARRRVGPPAGPGGCGMTRRAAAHLETFTRSAWKFLLGRERSSGGRASGLTAGPLGRGGLTFRLACPMHRPSPRR